MGAIAYKKTPTTDEAWDSGENVKKLSNTEADLRGAAAWVDGSMDPDTKSAYKEWHHMVNEDGSVGAANLTACSSVIANLNGARTPPNIPDGDKEAVHRHVAHHLTDAGKDAPELKSARGRRAWDSTEVPPHPHDDASHEHSHRDANGETVTHTHDHHHDDGSVGHESDVHDHREVPMFAARRPVTYASPRSRVATGATLERLERRSPGRIEVRASRNGAPMICGYAAVYNALTTIDDWFGSYMEKCGTGCFTKTLADGADVRALYNHDPNFVLGRTKSGTLRLSEDDHGLAYEADPPDTQWARDLCETMRRGDVDGSSFGFRVIRDKWSTIVDPTNPDPDADGDIDAMDCRTLLEVQLFDVSPVAFPAYPQTDSAVRAALSGAGFDLDLLTRVVVRAHRGLALATRDRATIRAAIDYLHRLTPPIATASTGAPTLSGHPPTRAQPRDPRPLPVTSTTPTRTGHVEEQLAAHGERLVKDRWLFEQLARIPTD